MTTLKKYEQQTTVQKLLPKTMQSVLSSYAGSLVTGHCLCHSFPLLCAAPPSSPSHPAVVFAPARALLASCPAPPATRPSSYCSDLDIDSLERRFKSPGLPSTC